MIEKEKILKDPEDNSADELLDAIRRGIVKESELLALPDELYSKQAKGKLRVLIEKEKYKAEEDDWSMLQSCLSEESLRNFIAIYPGGKHNRMARNKLEEICWTKLTKSHPSLQQIESFLLEFPTGAHQKEAEALMDGIIWNRSVDQIVLKKWNEIEKDIDITDKNGEFLEYLKTNLKEDKFKPEDILSMISYDHNCMKSFVVNKLIDDGYITRTQLKDAGIDEAFLKYMTLNPPSGFKKPLSESNVKLEMIADGFTEFYFWGIPSSGKTCALAGILSAANSGHVCDLFMPKKDSQGYGYMCSLSDMFKSGMVTELPGSTPVVATYEMRFDLEGRYKEVKKNGKVEYDNRSYRCAAIDLAGELFCCIHREMAGERLNQQQTNALEILKNILVNNKSKNRKIHFFVIEYGAENRLYKGHTQDVYLQSCMRYIEENKIFDRLTDRVYIMVSKSDKFDISQRTEEEVLCQYIKDNYMGLYSNLSRICEKYEINDGEPGLIPFTLGDVCFQDYCRFHPGKAESVVYDCFLDTVYGKDMGVWGKIKSVFSK